MSANNPAQKLRTPRYDEPPFPWIIRTCIVRLGRTKPDSAGNQEIGPDLYYPTNHGAVGVSKVYAQTYGSQGYALVIETDFAAYDDEICCDAQANVDAQLAAKGIIAGCSGGGPLTKILLYTTRPTPRAWFDPSAGSYPAGTLLAPQGNAMNLDSDNLWITFKSYRPRQIELTYPDGLVMP